MVIFFFLGLSFLGIITGFGLLVMAGFAAFNANIASARVGYATYGVG